MKSLRRVLSIRGKVLLLAVFAFGATLLFYPITLSDTVANANSFDAPPRPTSPAVTFPANPASLGQIPDSPAGGTTCGDYSGLPLNVTFTVAGMTAPLGNVGVSITSGSLVHSWVGDLDVTLRAPGDAAVRTIFKQTGETTSATGCGDSSDLSGPYTFFDTAPASPTWWGAAATAGATSPVPVTNYRSSTAGGSAGGGTNTLITPTFAGLSTGQINGTWTLRFHDGGQGDTGAIIAASLTLTSSAPLNARSDFDGDGKSDVSVFRPSEGNWYLNRSTDGFAVINWGLSTDIPAPGDFDGDGKADTAIFRPSTGTWWILRSAGGFSQTPFGLSGDIPVVGDYNGDGVSDIAVFRPSTNVWYIQYTGGGQLITGFGASGDLPVRGDYNGDGVTDIAIYRPSTGTWWIANSGGGLSVIPFGVSTDKPVPADYDGDTKDDVAIYRPSNGQWWIRRSSNGSITASAFGTSTDIPVPGDYDGDGSDDLAIYRNGVWWLNRSTNGIAVVSFGLSTDVPIPSKYIP